MKTLALILILASPVLAGGPQFGPQYDSDKTNMEFQNVYHDMAGLARTIGATNGSEACTGCVGEVVSSATLRTSAVALTSTQGRTIAQITLTPGDWDVRAMMQFHTGAGATTISDLEGSISLNSGSLSGGDTEAAPDTTGQVRVSQQFSGTNLSPGSGGNDYALPPVVSRINVTTSTIYYLVTQANFATSTLSTYGSLVARRAR